MTLQRTPIALALALAACTAKAPSNPKPPSASAASSEAQRRSGTVHATVTKTIDTAGELPPGHPPIGDAHGKQATAEVGAIHVARASGAGGRTIAEIWSRRSQLVGQNIAVRGQVVKATNGVLGKNWLHLRDGTGEGDAADLTVASTDGAAIGDTVLVTGVVQIDRDLGAGYRYAVLVDDARIQTE